MKRISLLLLLVTSMVQAQNVNIPDPVFKIFLLIADTGNGIALGPASNPIKVDANNDGQIQENEALGVYTLNLGNTIISDLTGISSFTNLTHLDIHSSQLTSLDVSALVNLKRLNCSGNQLTSLDVSALANLDFLFCDVNAISSLVVGALPNLKYLSCNDNNLAALDLDGLPGLQALSCANNQLASLSLTNLPQLATLQCDHNQLADLDISDLPSLTQLYCFYNLLTDLDLSSAANLTHLSCGENNIATLNLNGLSQLSALECSYLPDNAVINGMNLDALDVFGYAGSNATLTLNGFQSVNSVTLSLSQPAVTLNISGFGNQSAIYMYGSAVTSMTVNGIGPVGLGSLGISNNQLTGLALNGLESLSNLNCANNRLVTLSLNNLPGLERLDCGGNELTSLNLAGLPNLEYLDCRNNKLSGLNISGLASLKYLDCSNHITVDIIGNQITSLDLAGLANLEYLDCSNYGFDGIIGAAGNLVSSLNVNNLTGLKQLKCSKNNLTSLVVNGLTGLTTLDCSYNNLTSLDLIGLTDLTYLNYASNQLSSLNMTGLVNITDLDCSDNAIETLNLSALPHLAHLNCSTNALTELDLSGLPLITELRCDSNQIASLDLSGMPGLSMLSCGNNQLSALDLSGVPGLRTLHCGGNDLSALDVSLLAQLEVFSCSGNQLTNLDVGAQTQMYDFACDINQLTSLNVGNSPLLTHLNCAQNQLSALDLGNQHDLITLGCGGNQLTTLDVSQSPLLRSLSCDGNLFTTLDLSAQVGLTDLWCTDNPLLAQLLIKNGSYQTNLNIVDNPSLSYICADDIELAYVQDQLNGLGMTSTVCNSYCSFSPGGPHNTVTGTTIFDGNDNGCNLNDPLHPNIRLDFTDGATTGSAFTNSDGTSTFYAGAGSYTLSPNIENPAAFTISPASASVTFPDNQNNVSNQSFCLSPNGVHPDIEIVIAPIGPARPGFDAAYEIVYKNKGNQALSGTVILGFDDARLDLVSSVPAEEGQGSNSLQWAYSGLLPFESRVIRLEFNVNSPVETPAVNDGDILPFTVSVTPDAGDETPADNAFAFHQVVVNSFDPNDITCLEGEVLPPAEIGNYLHYIVNFENTGSASAVNVVVRTTVDEGQYDLHSLQVLRTSHQASTRIYDNVVEFLFKDIELDAAAGDPAVGGHGNVLFKIRTDGGLNPDDFVTKQADIFFDYNAPIVTNEVSTVFQSLGVPGFGTDPGISVYPNPAKDFVRVQSTSALRALELFDMGGRLLQTRFGSDTIDLSSRSAGVYFLRITSEKGSKVEKIVRN